MRRLDAAEGQAVPLAAGEESTMDRGKGLFILLCHFGLDYHGRGICQVLPAGRLGSVDGRLFALSRNPSPVCRCLPLISLPDFLMRECGENGLQPRRAAGVNYWAV